MTVLGVDAFAKGWVGVLWGGPGTVPTARHGRDLTTLMAVADGLVGPPDVVGIDIPIALPESGQRHSDLAVRALLGPRRASLFMTPVQAAVAEDDWAVASAHQRARAGSGMSKQAHALRHSIRQAMGWAASTGRALHEVHPETSFAFLASDGTLPALPMAASKQTWAGAMTRRALLVGAGLTLPDDLGPTGAVVPPIDVLDAAAAAWSAWRIASGQARSWPVEAEAGEPLIWA